MQGTKEKEVSGRIEGRRPLQIDPCRGCGPARCLQTACVGPAIPGLSFTPITFTVPDDKPPENGRALRDREEYIRLLLDSTAEAVLPSVLSEARGEGRRRGASRMTKENAIGDRNRKRSFDIECAEALLEEVVACLKRQFAALEDAVEDLKRSHQHPAPSPCRRRGGKNG